MTTLPTIDNATARRLFLDRHGLGERTATGARGPDLLGIIRQLGFVQVDSINTVERAHHMILHARCPTYRPANLRPLLERDRSLFEHWTHDAAIIPTEFFPHWQLRFERDAVLLRNRWKNWRRDGFEQQFETVLSQIRESGPAGSGDVGSGEPRSSGGWWDWHPSKTALEFLWRTGQLSVTRREAFRKIYDLTERVLPAAVRDQVPSKDVTIDWACEAALDRLGFATAGEIAAFWDKVTPAEARNWCNRKLDQGDLIEVDVTGADGVARRSLMKPEALEQSKLSEPPRSIRVLSPFDPALRDRKRAERLFGFHYRIEIFVPAAKRTYGYYVFPVLEGVRLIGRIDMKCNRNADTLHVTAFWPEPGIQTGKGRLRRLQTALERTARFASVSNVSFEANWLRV